ncbi:MAG TPA: MBOAT family protein [Candidatus Hydrogenedentes bacterium]|nr:MBOAT family protein [Candidatus Hydrogenedentota bacterium]
MLFNSLHYVLFLPVVVAAYFALPQRLRTAFLLAASYYFYMCWKLEYIVLILASTLIDYCAGIVMGRITDPSARRACVSVSIGANLLLLFSFKYFNFFNDAVRAAFDQVNIAYHIPALNVLLPVGISFYTFQSLSYTIDVYRGKREPERNLLTFALYVAFFPQLVAGPIERSTRLMPQFKRRNRFDPERVRDGLLLMGWGYFKKLVIADRLVLYVDAVYGAPGEYAAPTLLLATYFFAFQIYCDFSGYSDIAIGTARVLGYDLMSNFRRPYFSASMRDFWRRWHISLSTWFRDYLYIPLGGNRVSAWRRYGNVLIVFLLSGLWHGADWTFLLWGLLHGLLFVASLATHPLRQRIGGESGGLRRGFAVLVTFHLVTLLWVFFRADSLADALAILDGLLVHPRLDASAVFEPLGGIEMLVAACSLGLLAAVSLVQERGVSIRAWLHTQPLWARWAAYYALAFGVLLLGRFDARQFVYFQF